MLALPSEVALFFLPPMEIVYDLVGKIFNDFNCTLLPKEIKQVISMSVLVQFDNKFS